MVILLSILGLFQVSLKPAIFALNDLLSYLKIISKIEEPSEIFEAASGYPFKPSEQLHNAFLKADRIKNVQERYINSTFSSGNNLLKQCKLIKT